MLNNITRKEIVFVFLLSLLIIFITSLPYIYGAISANDNEHFTGLYYVDTPDTNAYLSWIQQGHEGHLLFKNLFSIEDQGRNIFLPLFFVLGVAANLFNISNILIYHLARVIFGFIFLGLSYTFISYFFEDRLKRKVAFLLLIFTSGLGYFLKNYIDSTDLWVTPSTTFLNLFGSPLNLVSISLMMLIILLYLEAVKKNKLGYLLLAALLLFSLSLIHPHLVVVILSTIILFLILLGLFKEKNLLKKYLKNLVYLILFLLPGGIYLLYVTNIDKTLNIWLYKTHYLSPSPLAFISGYGLIFLLAVIGLIKIFRKNESKKYAFILSWLLGAVFLLYQPWFLLHFQRKFSEGLHLPIVILATEGIFVITNFIKYQYTRGRIKKDYSKKTIVGIILVSAITNISILLHSIAIYQAKSLPFYLSGEYREAINWAGKNTHNDDIMLTSYWVGNFIPGQTGNVVYLGHNDLTINPQEKEKKLNWFFSSKDEESEKYQFLKNSGIKYIFSSPDIDNRTFLENNKEIEFLEEAFRNQTITILKVKGILKELEQE